MKEDEKRERERMSLATFSAPSNEEYLAGSCSCACNPLRVSVAQATGASATLHRALLPHVALAAGNPRIHEMRIQASNNNNNNNMQKTHDAGGCRAPPEGDWALWPGPTEPAARSGLRRLRPHHSWLLGKRAASSPSGYRPRDARSLPQWVAHASESTHEMRIQASVWTQDLGAWT